jgi:type IV pilus assembly protein PilA
MSLTRPAERGFTLIELMIVIAIIAIIAAIALPSIVEARKSSNETAAIGFLKALHTAQELFKDRDSDRNGVQDYAGNIHLLGGARLVSYKAAGPAAAQRDGYYYAVWIPGGAGQASFAWTAIAVPISYGKSGDRSFGINEAGTIFFNTNQIDFQNPPLPSTWAPIGG